MLELLEIDNLTLSRSQKIICHNLTFAFEPGQFWGVLGGNGRGKTTLLHALAGLISPAKGQVLLQNYPISDVPRKKLALKMGLLLQTETLALPIKTKDSILIGRYAHNQKLKDTDELYDIMSYFGLTSLADRNISALSGGEQRRVSIARVCYQQPQIYLLDEPINQLDPIYQHRLLSLMKIFCRQQNALVIMTGHHVDIMSLYCDHFLMMEEKGQVVGGPTRYILNNENLANVYGQMMLLCP